MAADAPPRFSAPPPPPGDALVDLPGAREAPLPDFIPPMLATPVDAAFRSPEWLFEVKWDGYRVETVVRDGRARIWTRNRKDAATYFPDLAGPAAWIRRERGDRRRRGRRPRCAGPSRPSDCSRSGRG